MKRCRILSSFFFFLLCMSLFCLSAYAYDIRDVKPPQSATKIVYGQSGAGRDLVAYCFGNGSNVLVAGFAIHGYEDNFNKDGGCLVYTANELMKVLDQNRDRITDYGWTVYVLPCMNPDGLIDGYTCNGPGRCTTTYLNGSGQLIYGRGVDLNRSFPKNWTQYTDSRYFNGSGPLASKEAQALAQFIKNAKGKGNNICIDAHGWYHQILTSNGNSSKLYSAFATRFPGSSYANCTNSRGYFTSYAASLGYSSCLFEFPADVYSLTGFINSGYCGKFNSAILELLKSYGTYNNHSSSCPSRDFTDVNPWKWYHSAVDYVLSTGIFNGVTKTQFLPNGQMTRAMLVTTLYRMNQKNIGVMSTELECVPDVLDERGRLKEGGSISFSDVSENAWYGAAVTWAAKNGIVKGYPDGTFAPNAALTREQLAAIFYRYAMWRGRNVSVNTDLNKYPDAVNVSAYAYDAMCWAINSGVITGISNDGKHVFLSPRGTATRAQAATIFMRFCGESTKEVANKTPQYSQMEPNIVEGFGDLGGN